MQFQDHHEWCRRFHATDVKKLLGKSNPFKIHTMTLWASIKKTMKLWKMKLQRRNKEGVNGAKKSLGENDGVKPSRSATSTIGVSCLKKTDYETGDSVFDSRRTGSVSTALNSVNERTVTTCGSWSRGKKVRFDVVEIRNYERIASDNPCCSSGPPIG